MTTTDPHRSTTDLGRRSKGPDPFSNNLLATIVVIILLNLVTCLASAVEHPSAQVAKANRRKALDRQRRVIFNDDTYELSRKDANTPEGFLRRRLQPLTGTHVDTISWSVLGGWADAPVYDSKVQPIYGDAHGGPPPYWSAVTKNVKQLIAAGHCPLQIVIDFAHQNDMELFASVRMNDCHDSFIAGGVTLWKKAHPEFLVDRADVPQDKDKHPLGLYVIAQDFSQQEVRDRKFEIIEEVCRRYDIDGIDLNFIRHPVFFSRTMRGLPVTDEQRGIMTTFVERVRRLTEAEGARRGRPILVAAVVPDNLRLATNVGLDVEAWIKRDLIDIVIPGLGYAPFSLPVKKFTDFAHEYGVKVYPCINIQAPRGVAGSAISDGHRGVATNWYRDGADGLFFWNLGTPIEYKSGDELVAIRERHYATLSELGDPGAIKYKDKLFAVDSPVLSYYQHISSTPPLPVELESRSVKQVPFTVGDDVRAAEKEGRLANVKLVLRFADRVHRDALGGSLRLNGHALQDGQVTGEDERQWEYDLSAQLINQGLNTLEASYNGGQNRVTLSGLRLFVRYTEPSASKRAGSVRVASLSILPKKWDKDANSKKIERMVREAAERGAQLVITPEGVLEGYVVNEVNGEQDSAKKKALTRRFHELAEPIDGRYIKRFQRLSDELDIHLVLGFLEVDSDRLYNTAALLGPAGELVGKYRKTHFAQGYDVNPPGYTPGKDYPVFDTGSIKVGVMICFDRALPEPARLLALGGADLIVCPAYGGYGELNRWRMRVRANENDVHVVFTHPQQSLIIDRTGSPLAEKTEADAIVLSDIPSTGPTRTNPRLRNRRPETFDKLNSR